MERMPDGNELWERTTGKEGEWEETLARTLQVKNTWAWLYMDCGKELYEETVESSKRIL